MTPCCYERLDTTQSQIRLLDLMPASGADETLEIHLHHRPLDAAGDYTCLSYAWGDPEPVRSVRLNGRHFNVRDNLFAALLRLRDLDKPRRLWIDAICINQDDVKERESQVLLMQDIYSNATDVIAWIGEDNGEHDARAVAFVQTIRALCPDIGGIAINPGTITWIEKVTPWGLVGSLWLDFTALIERPWFSRIWIVQEVVMGKSVKVWCGHHQLDWMDLFHCALFVNEHARVISAFAAPACLKDHDPEKLRFWQSSNPMGRLIAGIQNIRSIGYLVSRQMLHRMMTDLIMPVFERQEMKERLLGRETGRLWGEIYDDRFNIDIFHSSEGEADVTLIARIAPTDGPHGIDALGAEITDDETKRKRRWPRRVHAVVGDFLPIYSTPPTWQDYQIESGWSLYELISRFRRFSATDPRDKVYALIGVAIKAERTMETPPLISYDPEVQVFDVIWKVLDAVLQQRHALRFLRDACGIERPHGLPSWMPLWYEDSKAFDRRTSPFSALEDFQRRPHCVYTACGKSGAITRMVEGENLLQVGVFLAAEIHDISDVFDREDSSGSRLRWAEMLGLQKVEKMNQILSALVVVKAITEEDSRDRLLKYQREQGPGTMELYQRFFGTLMASTSDAGSQALCQPPADSDTAMIADMMVNGSTDRHFSHPSQSHIEQRIAEVCQGRRLFMWREQEGKVQNYGLCPSNAQQGDLVAMFLGSGVLHVIRPTSADLMGSVRYSLVGEAYVHNWMNGQLLDKMQTSEPGGIIAHFVSLE
ncbi:heterokaryon incompatibility protein-domain-containing protein [Podospora australis]|uniref:Heterokaryon incompatibility protein-domain-containing protein n=1 Tax=Podospora australis TaxID=1536484 RepID=A0AAN7AER4_9PEZI|nr:heterokaryon incompatibility protein-domain-containing protein [Podospora australis]